MFLELSLLKKTHVFRAFGRTRTHLHLPTGKWQTADSARQANVIHRGANQAIQPGVTLTPGFLLRDDQPLSGCYALQVRAKQSD